MTHSDLHDGFTVDQLSTAFDQVADPADWRAPIAATIAAEDFGLVSAAVEFYTATKVVVDRQCGERELVVSAIGYRDGPAGP